MPSIGISFEKGWAIPGPMPTTGNWWHSALVAVPRSPALMLLILALGVICVRLPFFDHSVLSADESVYLMIGAGMREGLIPYVDIVDRKPIGIFLIFGAADLFFKDPIIGVRILGAISTLVASLILVRMARRFLGLGPFASVLAGLLYSTYSLLFYGDSGQTPVFYMPFVIAGTALILRELRRIRHGVPPNAWRLGLAGLALGISLQIKYSTFFECVLFGGLLLFTAWQHRGGLDTKGVTASIVGAGAMLIGGLAPTALAYAVYVAIGHADAFVFYNFTANLERQATDFPANLIIFRALLFIAALLPLAILGGRYIWSRTQGKGADSGLAGKRWVHTFLLLWFLGTLFGALAQQQPYATYFFDTLAPLALLAAANLQYRANAPRSVVALARTAAVVLTLGVAGYIGLHLQKIADNGSPYLPAAIAQDIKDQGATSMYVFNYYGIMYPLTKIALPTRYPLPDHLLRDLEAASYQFDALAELRRIFDQNPSVVLVQTPMSSRIPADRKQILENELTAEYCLWRAYEAGAKHVNVYMHKNAALHSIDTACVSPHEPSEWVSATKPHDKPRPRDPA